MAKLTRKIPNLSVSSPSSKIHHNISFSIHTNCFFLLNGPFFSVQFLCHISSKCSLFACIFIIHEKKKESKLIYSIYLLFSFSFFLFFFLFIFVSFPGMQPKITTTVCEETYSPKSYRYHPGLWSGKKWSCCKTVNRTAFGCQAATLWTETNNNPSPSKLSSFLFMLHIFI